MGAFMHLVVAEAAYCFDVTVILTLTSGLNSRMILSGAHLLH